MFFIEESIGDLEWVRITGEDAHHIMKVFRFGSGDTINVSDRRHNWCCAVIEDIDTKSNVVLARILSRDDITGVVPKITLMQGIPKGNKMDFVLQKNTEIGVSCFCPVITERTLVVLSDEKDQKRRSRWQRIARESAKQCVRPDIPKVLPYSNFHEVIDTAQEYDLALIPWEKERKRDLRSVFKDCGNAVFDVAVLIGPEGGFSQKEIQEAVEAGFLSVSLGPRILRTETAGMVISSILMYEFG